MLLPGFFGQHFAFGANEVAGEVPDRAMKAFVGQAQAKSDPSFIDDALPAANAVRDLIDVVVAQPFIQCRQCRNLLGHDFPA